MSSYSSGCGSSCGSTCGINEKPTAAAPDEVARAAEALAGLLAETQAFQGLGRWSRAVRLDPEVSALAAALQERAYTYDSAAETGIQALEDQLEALPVVASFRAAETEARGLFGAVDAALSQTVGLPFARLAKPSG